MARTPEQLIQDLRDRLLEAAAKIAEPKVARWSKHLARAMKIVASEPQAGFLYIPHYWAVYVNDGRRASTPTRTTYFVWFRDPAKDPRFTGSHTPERANQVRRLTQREWRYYLAIRRAQLLAGKEPDMIIARQVRGTPPRKFFDNDGGMAGFLAEANRVGQETYREFVRLYLGDLMNMKLSNVVKT